MKTIKDELDERDKFEIDILDKYNDKLNKFFQIVYEVELDVSWNKIYRPSSESNFIIINATSDVPAGETFDGTLLDDDKHIDVAFIIPWKMLDDDYTPYQMADAFNDVSLFRQLVDANEFFLYLKQPDVTMDSIMEKLVEAGFKGSSENINKTIETPASTSTPEVTFTTDYPDFLKGFDWDALTADQKERFFQTTSIKIIGNSGA